MAQSRVHAAIILLLCGATLTASGGPATVQCPRGMECAWIPAGRAPLGNGNDPAHYGHYDVADRRCGVSCDQRQPPIRYIVLHDTETPYRATVAEAVNPAWRASWHYTVRSHDGHVAQHIRTEDISWNSGNWSINTQAIGIEHEGYAAAPAAYTEASYRSSAALVRYLAKRYRIPLDREHIIGHDNVPALSPDKVVTMHTDPGPYWDWAHYFDLLGAPLYPPARSADLGAVMIAPDYRRHVVAYTGCADGPCAPHGSSEVVLRQAPDARAPLLPDLGLHPDGRPSTMGVPDEGARASAGQRFAVAARRGRWTAIWFQGRVGWLDGDLRPVRATLVTSQRCGRPIPVYGAVFPEAAATPSGVEPRLAPPLQYPLPAGQWYTLAGEQLSMLYRAVSYDGSARADRTLIHGTRRYLTIQFGHRLAFVDADDVVTAPSTDAARRRCAL